MSSADLVAPAHDSATHNAPGAIVVGAGHNGLIAAAYLARAGLRVVVLEASERLGGQAATETAVGGARVNICNCDHTMFRATPIASELGLAAHGLRYLDLDPAFTAIPWSGGPAFFVMHDTGRTIAGLQATYPDDVAGYRRYLADALPLARLALDVANDIPTPGSAVPKALRRPRGIRTLLDWQRHSAGDVARRYFRSDALQAALCTVGPAVWGLHPEVPGTGMGALGFAMRHAVRPGRPVGGSGALAQALYGALSAAGGSVRFGARVETLLVEPTGADRAAVRGVRLVGGEEVQAPIIVSAIEPRTAIVEWVGARTGLPGAWHALADRYRAAPEIDGYEAKVDAVIDGPISYRQVDAAVCARVGLDPDRDVASSTVFVSPTMIEMVAAHGEKQAGRVAARPMLLAQMPSVLDPTLTTDLASGHHVLSLEVLWTPWALSGGWAASHEPQRWIDLFGSLLREPSVADRVVAQRTLGPVDYDARFAMPKGHSASFSGTPLTALLGRLPEQTRYRTPIDGLFLCGAGTFPGAGVWGASGRNAAQAVLRS